MPKTIQYEAFDGQVIFHMLRRTQRVRLRQHRMYQELMQLEGSDLQGAGAVMSAFYILLSTTHDIEFHLEKPVSDELQGLKDYWTEAKGNSDYASLWELYLDEIYDSVASVWDEAYAATAYNALHGDEDLRPEEEMEQAQLDNPLSSNGASTSAKTRAVKSKA